MTAARRITVAAALFTALLAGGCNTISGVGRDVSAAGRAVSHTAEDLKR